MTQSIVCFTLVNLYGGNSYYLKPKANPVLYASIALLAISVALAGNATLANPSRAMRVYRWGRSLQIVAFGLQISIRSAK